MPLRICIQHDPCSPEREQHRVLLAKMREFAGSEDRRCVLARKPHQAAILSTTRVGLAAAEEVFGGSGAVILQESERGARGHTGLF